MEKFNAMRTRLLQHLQKKAIRSKSIMTLVCLLLASASAFAQTKTVTGTVTDAANEPLIGASVLVQGTSTGTITDMDGKYSISVTPEDVLAFSYVGMTSQTIKVGTQNVINVTLKEDSQVLAETVVIGYGSAKKRDLTGSITNIKGEELANKPAMNPLSSLQGKVAGVQIVNSGRAGSDPEIRIRGTNSINGYKPLYIVDGLFNDNINFLNPEDIESMEILKDPSSLAIFGVRGANGVIIITTKKAKEGQTLVNINTSFGFKKVVDKVKLVNGSQFKELYNEQLANQGDDPFDYTGWDANTDWQDEIFQTAFITNNNISITGASPKHSFYLGVGYSYEQGNIEHEKFSKVTINASNDYKITDFLKVGFQFNGARMLPADSKQVLNALRATPIAPVYNNEYGLYTALPEFQKAQISNPMVDVELKANTTKAENYRASGNIYGEVDFLKHFTFKAMFSMDYASNNGRTYTPIVKVYDAAVNGGISTLGTGKTEVSQFKENETKVQSDYLLTYTNSFDNGNHNLTATAGFTTYYNSLSRLDGARKQGVGLVIPDDPDKWFVSIGDAATATNGSTQWERSTVSMLARVIYNYKGKYLFNGSFRRDGSSAFSYTGNEWQNFFSLGGGWLMSEEEFMKDIHWINNLKVRASWGQLGNINNVGQYDYFSTYAQGGNYNFEDTVVNGIIEAKPANVGLGWETVTVTNIGVDFDIFNGLLSFTGDYYDKQTKDILMSYPSPFEVGIPSDYKVSQNIGKVSNKGIEIAVTHNNRIGDFSYSIGGNITKNWNKVKDLGANDPMIEDPWIKKVGYAIGTFYGYRSDGLLTQEDIDSGNYITDGNAKPNAGDIKYVDLDGDKKLTDKDRDYIGCDVPDITYGINLNMQYKGFDLSVFGQGVSGTKVRFYQEQAWAFSDYASPREYHLKRWTVENPNPNAAYPRIYPRTSAHSTFNNKFSDFWLFDADYFRIKNITLGYTFQKNVVQSLGVEVLKLYVAAENPFTIRADHRMEDFDPETASGRGGNTRGTASLSFGVNLTF